MIRIESLLSARLFVGYPSVGRMGGCTFLSNLIGGNLSLYAMDAQAGGSVPETVACPPPTWPWQNPGAGAERL